MSSVRTFAFDSDTDPGEIRRDRGRVTPTTIPVRSWLGTTFSRLAAHARSLPKVRRWRGELKRCSSERRGVPTSAVEFRSADGKFTGNMWVTRENTVYWAAQFAVITRSVARICQSIPGRIRTCDLRIRNPSPPLFLDPVCICKYNSCNTLEFAHRSSLQLKRTQL